MQFIEIVYLQYLYFILAFFASEFIKKQTSLIFFEHTVFLKVEVLMIVTVSCSWQKCSQNIYWKTSKGFLLFNRKSVHVCTVQICTVF